MNRLAALHLAGHRANLRRKGLQSCRRCGGQSRGPYCKRHWRLLIGCSPFDHYASNRERLDEVDEFVRFRESCHLFVVDGHTWRVGPNSTLRESTGNPGSDRSWVFRVIRPGGEEIEIARFPTLMTAIRYLNERRHDMSSRNHSASKRLIRRL